jgi:hypothetical protein
MIWFQNLFIHSFIHQWLYSHLLGLRLFFSFVIFFTQSVGLLGRGISPSQGRCLHTGQHKHRIKTHTDVHALSVIRTHDPSFWASEDSSGLTPRGHCDVRFQNPECYNVKISGTYINRCALNGFTEKCAEYDDNVCGWHSFKPHSNYCALSNYNGLISRKLICRFLVWATSTKFHWILRRIF